MHLQLNNDTGKFEEKELSEEVKVNSRETIYDSFVKDLPKSKVVEWAGKPIKSKSK